jgi:hypothetical protein
VQLEPLVDGHGFPQESVANWLVGAVGGYAGRSFKTGKAQGDDLSLRPG